EATKRTARLIRGSTFSRGVVSCTHRGWRREVEVPACGIPPFRLHPVCSRDLTFRRFRPKQPNDDHDHRHDHDSDQQLKGGVQVHRPEPDCFVIKQPAACYFNEETLELAQMTGTTRLRGANPAGPARSAPGEQD